MTKDTKVSEFIEETSVLYNDRVPFISDPSGSPKARIAPINNFLSGKEITVAASDAPERWKKHADYICNADADDVEIAAAFAAGQVVRLSPGTFVPAAKVTMPAGSMWLGSGRRDTIIQPAAGSNFTFLDMANNCVIQDIKFQIPTTQLVDVIYTRAAHCAMKRLSFYGGNSTTPYIIRLDGQLYADISDIYSEAAMNGIVISNDVTPYHTGGDHLHHIKIVITKPGTTGLLLDSSAELVNGNSINQLFVIAVVAANGVGSTCLSIVGAAFNAFYQPFLEGCDTTLNLQGNAINPAANNDFYTPYIDAAVTIGAKAYYTNFYGGQIAGTITDSCDAPHLGTRYYGVKAGPGTLVGEHSGVTANRADGDAISHLLALTPTKVWVTGTVAGEICTVSGITSAHFHVDIKKNDGTAGTSQTIYWRAEV